MINTTYLIPILISCLGMIKTKRLVLFFFLTILLCNFIPENLSYFYVLTLLKMNGQYAREPHFVLTLRYLHIIYVYIVSKYCDIPDIPTRVL